jgi:hypothetical protein
MNRSVVRALVVAGAFAMVGRTSYAQDFLRTLVGGGTAGLGFGHAVANAGDVNGDGCDDVIVGYRFGSTAFGPNTGSATVWSGCTGALLYTFTGDTAQDAFGKAVAGAGDVNGDGRADVIVGAALDDNTGINSGSAKVFSGADGSLIYVFNGALARHNLGVAVAGVGDVNHDGRADVAVGANPELTLAQSHGYVKVFSGMDGSVLFTVTGAVKTSRLGFTIASAGDVNGDGTPDLVVGDPRDATHGTSAGAVRVYSGVNGAQLFVFVGDALNDQLGIAVGAAGDLDGDGHADVIGGTPWANGTAVDNGIARVWSGATGALMFEFRGDASLDFFGASVAGNADINADGTPDFMIGAYADDDLGTNSGSVRVYSGLDGSVLYRLDGNSSADEFGYAVCTAGDFNGDHGLDFAIGAPVDNQGGGINSGSVWIYAGIPPPPIGAENYCTSSPNSVGPGALISHVGSLSLADNDLFLIATGAPPQRFGMFFFSATQDEVRFGSGVLCIGRPAYPIPAVVRIAPDGVASKQLDFSVPAGHLQSITPDSVWNFQFIYRDRQAPRRGNHDASRGPVTNTSDGLSLTFKP